MKYNWTTKSTKRINTLRPGLCGDDPLPRLGFLWGVSSQSLGKYWQLNQPKTINLIWSRTMFLSHRTARFYFRKFAQHTIPQHMNSTRSAILLYNRVGACTGRWRWRWDEDDVLYFLQLVCNNARSFLSVCCLSFCSRYLSEQRESSFTYYCPGLSQ